MAEIPQVTIASGAAWQEVAEDRRKHRDATIAAIEPALPKFQDLPLNTIPLAKQVLTEEEIKITETTVEKLVVQLAKAELSAVSITKAFLRRAALAQLAVSSLSLTHIRRLTSYRRIALPNCFLPEPSSEPHISIPISKTMTSQLDRCTEYR